MSDTKRTLAELAALLADNTSGNISAQDVRDLMQSTHPESAMGHIEVLGTAPSTPFTGQAYYDTATQQLRVWTGTAWMSRNASEITEPLGVNLEGISAPITGGQGGTVYTVTNLNDSGAGSLRDAMLRSDTRIIEFSVAGNIDLLTPIHTSTSQGNVTIRGETAPAPGICVRINNPTLDFTPFIINGDNTIFQWFRIRAAGKRNPSNNGDNVLVAADNVAFNHMSISWGTDENFDIYRGTNIVFQWSISSEGLLPASAGFLMNGDIPISLSVHHSLFAHNVARMPAENCWEEVKVDWRNNITYNGFYQCYIHHLGAANNPDPQHAGGLNKTAYYNFVKNLEIAGLEPHDFGRTWYIEFWDERIGDPQYARVYESGNQMAPGNTMIANFNEQYRDLSPTWAAPAITEYDIPTMKSNVLAYAGASYRLDGADWVYARDAVDQRVVNDVVNNTGTRISEPSEVGGYPF